MATKDYDQNQDLCNGPVAASLIAGGIGSAVIGLMTALVEASVPVKNAMAWSGPVGPLSGKTGMGVIAFFLSWTILHFLWRGKNVNFQRAATIAFVLLAIGLLLTFPPIFDLFAPAGG